MKPRSLPRFSLRQQQVRQHLLQRSVAQPDLVDQRGRRGREQVGAQRVERQPAPSSAARRRRRPARACSAWPAVVDQRGTARPASRTGACRCGHAWPVSSTSTSSRSRSRPYPSVVLGRADRQHPQLGRRLGVEQEQDPVQVAQRLAGQLAAGLGVAGSGASPAPRGGSPPRWR